MNTKQTLCQRRSQSGYWLPLAIASILLSFSNSTVAAQESSPPKRNNDSAEVSEPIKSQIASLEEEIEKLKQFNELVNQYNQLIKDRRFAEAELVGKKARDLQPNEPHAIVMVEKAKMYRQFAFNKNVQERKEGFAEDTSAPMGSVIDDGQLKIFKLQNGNVKDVAHAIKNLYGGPTFAIEINEQTNSLVVHCYESELAEIAKVIQRLDTRPGSVAEPLTDSYPIDAVGQPVTSIAEYRAQLDALEQPVLQLAEQVRAAETKHGKDHPDSAKLRADLRALVKQTFAARQEIQRAELAEFTRRLQRMQQSIDSRDRIVDQIVERRIAELLDHEASWNTQ